MGAILILYKATYFLWIAPYIILWSEADTVYCDQRLTDAAIAETAPAAYRCYMTGYDLSMSPYKAPPHVVILGCYLLVFPFSLCKKSRIYSLFE